MYRWRRARLVRRQIEYHQTALAPDAGLGVKAYAVIEQGKIGQILSSRPAERRALIEEAAGVTKGAMYHYFSSKDDLLAEIYRADLTREDPGQFGVGDWLEVLRARRATGELIVTGDGRGYAIRLVRGSVAS